MAAEHVGTIVRTGALAAATDLQGMPGVEIEVSSADAFPVVNELWNLRIGTKDFVLSRYPSTGDTHTLIFTLTVEEFAQTTDGEPVIVQPGRNGVSDRWVLGALDKSLLTLP